MLKTIFSEAKLNPLIQTYPNPVVCIVRGLKSAAGYAMKYPEIQRSRESTILIISARHSGIEQ